MPANSSVDPPSRDTLPAAIDDLRAVPLFQGMSDRALDAVAGLATEIDIADGTAITSEGDDGDAFYLILEGAVRVTRAGGPVGSLGAGDFIGEISLIDGRPRTATTVAAGPVRALVVQRAEFWTWWSASRRCDSGS